jgi:competence protein ComEC
VAVEAIGTDRDVLIDCGASNSVRFATLPWLRSRGANQLPRLVLSHGDLQDVGGTELLRTELPVGEIVTSSWNFRSPVYRQIIRGLDESQSPRRILAPGECVAGWTMLHPTADDKFPQGDDASLVLHGECEGVRILLVSDLGRPGQEALLRRTNDLRAEIVITGLPEKTEPLSEAFLDRVAPQLIIVADADYPAPARASRRLRERLGSYPATVLFTRDSGAVEIIFRPAGWQWFTAR